MKREEKKETRKAKYEKPVLTKFRKLADVVANGSGPIGEPGVPGPSGPLLGCTRF